MLCSRQISMYSCYACFLRVHFLCFIDFIHSNAKLCYKTKYADTFSVIFKPNSKNIVLL